MKQSSHWVTCASFKQHRGWRSSYGMQDQKAQLQNKFLSLGNIGIYSFNNYPLINCSISNAYRDQVHQKKKNQGLRKEIPEIAHIPLIIPLIISVLLLMEYEKHQVKWQRKPAKCPKIYRCSFCVFCHISDFFLAYLSKHFEKKKGLKKSLLDCIPSHMTKENLVQWLHLSND